MVSHAPLFIPGSSFFSVGGKKEKVWKCMNCVSESYLTYGGKKVEPQVVAQVEPTARDQFIKGLRPGKEENGAPNQTQVRTQLFRGLD